MWAKVRAVGNVYSRCPRVVPVRASARIVHMSIALQQQSGSDRICGRLSQCV